MVNAGFTFPDAVTSQADAERRLVLAYAPAHARSGLAALLALDDTLADVLRTTREPMIGQMRLTWWHDALLRLDGAPAPHQPVLAALQSRVLPTMPAATLARLVEGWEELLDPGELGTDALARFADARGATLFEAAGAVLGSAPGDPLVHAGRAWALADLAVHCRDVKLSVRAGELAGAERAAVQRIRWSRNARPLGALMLLAFMRDAGALRRTGRAFVHRLTGL